MNINVKFYMYFNGERIRTLEDLRENFFAEDILEAYNSGQLAKWLKVWRHKEELEQVEAINSENAREILKELIRIFDPEAEAEEIDAELTVYDYLEERRKFREHMKTHGLDELEALRKERDTLQRKQDVITRERDTFRNERDNLQQENDHLKSELDEAKRITPPRTVDRQIKYTTSSSTKNRRIKRIDIPRGTIVSTWATIVSSGTACRITDIGNCRGKLLIMTNKASNSNLPIEEVCSNAMLLPGISVYVFSQPTKAEDLYFYCEEV